ncbi:MAG: hypothetical protein A2928_00140 [Candidatus Taylorbacteria bacterium RIFCSPLOWO2_01_FULL_45_15b]|uniref:phosphoribosylglycinamide formyltransferase 1 n=1 Tax=Candidatus Taylorbacteria bacterium RIFCSPLOWO2_01_FULL_45_15b TaxID=1802319 RepID=A0A1G2N8L1_9BACT|nr:MAG: hypothetical protein A2928_00140 [Candidatus Taylorbacteria bacterium RIFCSPLOWO2_01_FULL_45_15b]
MRLIILTGNQLRHKYFANTLAEHFSVMAILSERKIIDLGSKAGIIDPPLGTNEEEAKLWRWHFGLAHDEEERMFRDNVHFAKGLNVIEVPKGKINDNSYVDTLRKLRPDGIAVFGTSILKGEMIAAGEGKIINMHLGLSPYYRGSATNFWPLYNEEPEFVGVTVHLIDPGIDTGAIIHQGRPHVEENDNQHTIGNKTIVVGTELMKKSLEELKNGTIKSFKQTENGKLYQRKDFSPIHLKKIKQLLDGGMLGRYARSPKEVVLIP